MNHNCACGGRLQWRPEQIKDGRRIAVFQCDRCKREYQQRKRESKKPA